MKNFIALSLLCWTVNVFGQTGNVGIGTVLPASKLTVNGSFAASYGKITSTTYNASENDFYISWLGTAAGTITLPNSTAGINRAGRVYYIKNLSPVYTLTIDANGTELIDDNQTIVLKPSETVLCIKTDINTATGTTYEKVVLSKTEGDYVYAVSSSTPETHTQGVAVKGNFTSIDFSSNGGIDFNLATDTWTCPKSGYYRVEIMETGFHTANNVSAHRYISVLKNGIPQTEQYYTMTLLGISASQRTGGYDSTLLDLQQGDQITQRLLLCQGCGTASMTSLVRKMIIKRL